MEIRLPGYGNILYAVRFPRPVGVNDGAQNCDVRPNIQRFTKDVCAVILTVTAMSFAERHATGHRGTVRMSEPRLRMGTSDSNTGIY
jgi:hypothetical protein